MSLILEVAGFLPVSIVALLCPPDKVERDTINNNKHIQHK